jgi:hypothetical protein
VDAHIESFTGDCTDWIPSFKTNSISDFVNNQIVPDTINTLSTDADNAAISITPNPFKESFNVAFDVLIDGEKTSIKVYNLTGQLLFEHSGTESIGQHSYNIPVNASASLYIVEACMGGNCKSQKMIQNEME